MEAKNVGQLQVFNIIERMTTFLIYFLTITSLKSAWETVTHSRVWHTNGVPQASVGNPTLFNIAFTRHLRSSCPNYVDYF